MQSLPRQILCKLIAEHGPGLCRDARRCEWLMRDLCGQNRREINVLMAALRARVGVELLAAPSTTPRPALISRLARRLSDDFAMEEQAAAWAVEAWAIALGITEASDPAPAPAVADAPRAPLLSEPPGPLAAGGSAQVNVNPVDDATLLWIPPGEFAMGDDDQKDNPRRRVYLDGFWLYKVPVTVKQFAGFCAATGRKMPDPPSWGWQEDHPVVNVSWLDAAEYAAWAGVGLPTEAQWEKAARGPDGRLYPWGSTWDPARCAHSVGSARSTTAPGGSFPSGASPYGVLDLAGNVWQWCADWYDESYARSAPGRNPDGAVSGDRRVLRGGSWNDTMPFIFRSAMRFRYTPSGRFISFGFRCAVTSRSDE